MQVSAKEFSAKYKSKRECFNFLTVEAKTYLSAYETLTTYYLKWVLSLFLKFLYRDLIAGRKKKVKCDQVKIIFIPQYDKLTIETILDQAAFHPEVKDYLPDARDLPKLPR